MRNRLLAAVKQEMAPLESFHEAMRTASPQTGLSLHRLLSRAVELRDQIPELAPRDLERMPHYGLWQSHRERLGRLAGILEELQGDTVLARHPLRRLSSRVPSAERPLDFVATRLQSLEKLL